MFIPVNLRYTANHLWLRPIGRKDIYVGITDYAQKELGRIDSFEINCEGSIIRKDVPFGTIYGANKTIDLIMPRTGRILSLNGDVEINPRYLNSDTYHFWIALISISDDDLQTRFLINEEYLALIKQTQIIK
jgi:glycine cleavage system H protein